MKICLKRERFVRERLAIASDLDVMLQETNENLTLKLTVDWDEDVAGERLPTNSLSIRFYFERDEKLDDDGPPWAELVKKCAPDDVARCSTSRQTPRFGTWTPAT